jgi:hypothetical protein
MPHFPGPKKREKIFKKIFGEHPEVEKTVGEAFDALADTTKEQTPGHVAEEEDRRAKRSPDQHER